MKIFGYITSEICGFQKSERISSVRTVVIKIRAGKKVEPDSILNEVG